MQIARLKNLLGPDALHIYSTTTKLIEEQETVDSRREVLEKYCTPKKNVAMCAFNFFTRKEGQVESFDSFYTDLRHLSRACEFGAQEDKLIKCQIILGINSDQTQEKLLREDPELKKVIEFCKAVDATEKNMLMLKQSESTSQVFKIHADKPNYQKSTNATRFQNRNGDPNSVCSRCGYKHTNKQCPAKNKKCAKCNGMSHFAKMC